MDVPGFRMVAGTEKKEEKYTNLRGRSFRTTSWSSMIRSKSRWPKSSRAKGSLLGRFLVVGLLKGEKGGKRRSVNLCQDREDIPREKEPERTPGCSSWKDQGVPDLKRRKRLKHRRKGERVCGRFNFSEIICKLQREREGGGS